MQVSRPVAALGEGKRSQSRHKALRQCPPFNAADRIGADCAAFDIAGAGGLRQTAYLGEACLSDGRNRGFTGIYTELHDFGETFARFCRSLVV